MVRRGGEVSTRATWPDNSAGSAAARLVASRVHDPAVPGGAGFLGEGDVRRRQRAPAGFDLDADRVTAGMDRFDHGGADAGQRIDDEHPGVFAAVATAAVVVDDGGPLPRHRAQPLILLLDQEPRMATLGVQSVLCGPGCYAAGGGGGLVVLGTRQRVVGITRL
jgi:hypothetical protein